MPGTQTVFENGGGELKFADLVEEKGYCISFEQVSVPKNEGVNLRFIVHKAKESWQLRVHPQPDVEVVIYQIDFPYYMTFLAAVDSYTCWNENDRFKGDAFRIYEEASFLNHLEKEWQLSDPNLSNPNHPEKKPIVYALACIDHIIYIISQNEPIVTILTSDA